mmetsp:Transcript_60540/g.160122  ORF Transcript_60540/g.160122 Transcript_60540/m.160122 type:complete len:212 (+) Transcript_60540:1632-2267(+)
MLRALLMAPPTHATAAPPPGPNVSLLDARLTLAAPSARCAASLSPPLHPASSPPPGPCKLLRPPSPLVSLLLPASPPLPPPLLLCTALSAASDDARPERQPLCPSASCELTTGSSSSTHHGTAVRPEQRARSAAAFLRTAGAAAGARRRSSDLPHAPLSSRRNCRAHRRETCCQQPSRAGLLEEPGLPPASTAASAQPSGSGAAAGQAPPR